MSSRGTSLSVLGDLSVGKHIWGIRLIIWGQEEHNWVFWVFQMPFEREACNLTLSRFDLTWE